jgi:transcriptional pleiotropic repressor
MTLLEKVRTLNRLLQNAAGKPVSFREMSEALRETVKCDVFVVSRKGKILGSACSPQFQLAWLERTETGEMRFARETNEELLRVTDTVTGRGQDGMTALSDAAFDGMLVAIVPITGGGERLGTLLLARRDEGFGEEDLILAEYGATIVGMEILRERAEEREQEARNRAVVAVAVRSLSFSELEAAQHMFEALEGREGLLVASKIADRYGITRSVIVNALRKLESAGTIESRSLGMKGTYIRILNPFLLQELEIGDDSKDLP